MPEEEDLKSSLNREDLTTKINHLLSLQSRLSDEQFQYYKKKIQWNLDPCLENDLTKFVLTQFFKLFDQMMDSSESTYPAQKLLRDWMITDVSVSVWCPAFLKIVENVMA